MTMTDALYSQRFANARMSGGVPVACSARGTLAWSLPLARNTKVEARGLLVAGDTVFVDALQSLIACAPNGSRLWEREKFYGAPVAIRDGLIFYTSAARRSRMAAVDLNNQPRFEDMWIPDVGEQCSLVLFDPFERGLVAQVQFSDVPDADEQEVMLYRRVDGELGHAWSCRFPHGRATLPPIVCHEQGRIVSAVDGEAVILDPSASQRVAQPLARFPLPFGLDTRWVSADAAGNLHWCGSDKRCPSLCITDLSGKELWRWNTWDRLRGEDTIVAPPVLGAGRVHVVTTRAVYTIATGRTLWTYSAPAALAGATALGDGSLVVSGARHLVRLDAAGQRIFELPFDEPLVTPPVVDGAGHVYVASTGTLYAVH